MTNPLRILTLALLAGCAFGLTDCKKKSEPEPDKRSQREIWLTSAGWNIQLITQVITSGGTTSTHSGSPASYGFPLCALDDIIHYNRDRTVTVEEGPLTCQPPTTGGTWDFAANETELVSSSSPAYRNKIVSLTATTLELEISETDSYGNTIVQTTTYAAK
ncbi:hypothetical protein [Hymenobacter properus]|uniref:Lipocalin-like domain-containing protein n=1 Tax=Hymenobacter properus TaxID=2791026 RepID=A0A931FQ59_9BACT|nr:hypothetical protein [Hymenobacter properus]MBF9144269.1 hypothetical protein [Hymenobacter properus]MBR7723087.1 hypothetical protein [Microvirga sp. SRT04]